jgi:hypothetical protein
MVSVYVLLPILIPTFYPLFLTLAAGLTGTMLTGDLFNLFVFTELMVISGSILTAISDDRYGLEAAYKYFYISLIASLFLLLAAGGLYVSYGTLNMADLSQRIAADPSPPLVSVSMVMLIVFFMTKSAVVPFHFWQPDFHTVSPTAVSAMLSSVVVKLGVYGFMRMTTLWFLPQAEAPAADRRWAGWVFLRQLCRGGRQTCQTHAGLFHAGADRLHPGGCRVGHAAGAAGGGGLYLQSQPDQVGAADAGGRGGQPRFGQVGFLRYGRRVWKSAMPFAGAGCSLWAGWRWRAFLPPMALSASWRVPQWGGGGRVWHPAPAGRQPDLDCVCRARLPDPSSGGRAR